MAFDLLIKGGLVVDGTGDAPQVADVGIVDGRVAAVGRLDGPAVARDRRRRFASSLPDSSTITPTTTGR